MWLVEGRKEGVMLPRVAAHCGIMSRVANAMRGGRGRKEEGRKGWLEGGKDARKKGRAGMI